MACRVPVDARAGGSPLISLYPALFVASAYDRTGTPAPAVAGGLAAAVGDLNLAVVILVATSGGVLGEIAVYGIARTSRWGARYVGLEDRARRLEKLVPRAVRQFVRPEFAGRPVVLIFGRFLPVVGRLVAPLAGVAEVPIRTVALFTVLGQTALVASYTLLAFGMAKISGQESTLSVRGGATFGMLWILPFIGAGIYRAVHIGRSRIRRYADRRHPPEVPAEGGSAPGSPVTDERNSRDCP